MRACTRDRVFAGGGGGYRMQRRGGGRAGRVLPLSNQIDGAAVPHPYSCSRANFLSPSSRQLRTTARALDKPLD